VKPGPFTYHAPERVDEALGLLAEYGDEAKVLAGGQSLMPMLNFRLARVEHLVDINRIGRLEPWFADPVLTGDVVILPALVRQRQVERSAALAGALPLLAEALRHVAHPQIRNRGTVCGSLAHADPSAELPTVLSVLDATVTLVSARGTRTLPLADFFLFHLTTALEPDELLREVTIPRPAVGTATAFREFAPRRGDFALAAVGAAAGFDSRDRVESCRIAVAGVAPTPLRLTGLEEMLTGEPLDDAVIAGAAELTRSTVDPTGDAHAGATYRKRLAGILVSRALADLREHREATVVDVDVTVNGVRCQRAVEDRLTLADFLRERLRLTGTHLGCEHGVCGACTVIVDGAAVRSCLMLAAQADGCVVETVEGLAEGDELGPLQESFARHNALQCGFCTSGFLMSVTAALREGPVADEDAAREVLSGNICRCTGYRGLVRAVLEAGR
jgi:carbon-monoxide dehydrogenase medium subunit